MKTNKTLIRFAVFAVILFTAGSGAAIAFAQSQSAPVPVAATPNTFPAVVVSSAPLTNLSSLQGTFETIYNKVNPSVVNIQVVEQASASTFGSGFGFSNQQNAVPQQALGSGFVWDNAGHIVTNNHVVAGASSITVTFSDGTVATAKLVGADPNSDLAVIQVDVPASKLAPIQLADSTKAQVGEIVIAIGNPYGLQGTMTQGIISGLSRSLPVGLDSQTAQQGPTYSIPDIIQTDAAINPGNSGGVLVDSQGSLLGVTAAMESQSGSSSGIGFVIPSSIVAKVVPSLISTGTYNHPSLGFSSTDMAPEIAQAMNLPQTQQGALIVDVTSGGPADNAGLVGSTQAIMVNGQQTPVGGDIVTAINGQPVHSSDELSAYLFDNTQVGQTVTLTILRNGHEQSVKVTVGILPAQ